MFRVEISGYNFPWITLRVLEKDPHVYYEATKNSSKCDPLTTPNRSIDASSKGGVAPHLVVGY